MFKETIKDNSKDIPASLNNILKIMRRSKGPAQEGGFSSDDSRLAIVRAKYAPRFKTLEEVKNSRGNINPQQFMDKKESIALDYEDLQDSMFTQLVGTRQEQLVDMNTLGSDKYVNENIYLTILFEKITHTFNLLLI